MNYDRLPVSSLIRGPLLHTPQGLVVVAAALLYSVFAIAAMLLGVSPTLSKSPAAFFIVCLAWPGITFLYYVRSNAPGFRASFARTIEVAVAALLPVAYALWRLYAQSSAG